MQIPSYHVEKKTVIQRLRFLSWFLHSSSRANNKIRDLFENLFEAPWKNRNTKK